MKNVVLLGSTGSIGTSTIDLLKRERHRYRVEAVTAHRNVAALAQIARELGARFAAVADANSYRDLKDALAGSGIEVGAGEAALMEAGAGMCQAATWRTPFCLRMTASAGSILL